MKKTLFSLLTAGLFASTSMHAFAEDGTVAITGVIASQACNFTGTALSLTLPFGNYVMSDFPAAGTRGRSIAATFTLNSCPRGALVSYQFAASPDDNNPSLFKITEGDGYAKGIGIELKLIGTPDTPEEGIMDVTPGLVSGWIPVKLLTGAYGVPNKIQITPVSTLSKVTAGKLDSSITVSVKYN